jgi:uncharacterized membrane protein YheB (UPF0754 family)
MSDQIITSIEAFMGFSVGLLSLPIIGALIGWGTNYLAVKMLFRPKKSINLIFFRLQGVFPKRQKAFATKLGEVVSGELFSINDVTGSLKSRAVSDETIERVRKSIASMIMHKLPESFPMAAMFLSSELVEQITQSFKEDIRRSIGEMVEDLSGQLAGELDVHQIVEEKVAAFSVEKLESVVLSIMKKELRFIEFIGAVLGFLVGLVQILLLQLVS